MKYLRLVHRQQKHAVNEVPEVGRTPRGPQAVVRARTRKRDTFVTDGPFVETKEYLSGF